MADIYTKERRSEIMSHIRSKNTYPEKLLFNEIKKLWHQGFRYRKHSKKILGKPDLAFPTLKIAIFIDSEFWHGKNMEEWEKRLPNEFWKKKIKSNIKRDEEVNQLLAESGWRIFRFWTEEVEKNPGKIADEIENIIRGI